MAHRAGEGIADSNGYFITEGADATILLERDDEKETKSISFLDGDGAVKVSLPLEHISSILFQRVRSQHGNWTAGQVKIQVATTVTGAPAFIDTAAPIIFTMKLPLQDWDAMYHAYETIAGHNE